MLGNFGQICSKYGTFYDSRVIDVSLLDLRQAAGRRGCGKYYFADSVSELYGQWLYIYIYRSQYPITILYRSVFVIYASILRKQIDKE
jgi:hypothetical protein